MSRFLRITAICLLSISTFSAAHADDAAYSITFKNGSFEPKTLELPADKKVKLEISNEESKAIEFESHDMKAEKIIKPGKSRSVFVGPLKAGEYSFFNEFNEGESGKVVVK